MGNTGGGNINSNRQYARDLALAILLTGGATGLRYLLEPLVGSRSPLIIFVSAVAIAAQIGGTLPGLLVTGLSTPDLAGPSLQV
jgi:hypothetical protein